MDTNQDHNTNMEHKTNPLEHVHINTASPIPLNTLHMDPQNLT